MLGPILSILIIASSFHLVCGMFRSRHGSGGIEDVVPKQYLYPARSDAKASSSYRTTASTATTSEKDGRKATDKHAAAATFDNLPSKDQELLRNTLTYSAVGTSSNQAHLSLTQHAI